MSKIFSGTVKSHLENKTRTCDRDEEGQENGVGEKRALIAHMHNVGVNQGSVLVYYLCFTYAPLLHYLTEAQGFNMTPKHTI